MIDDEVKRLREMEMKNSVSDHVMVRLSEIVERNSHFVDRDVLRDDLRVVLARLDAAERRAAQAVEVLRMWHVELRGKAMSAGEHAAWIAGRAVLAEIEKL